MSPYDAAQALLHGTPTLPIHPDIDDGVDFTGKFYAADDKSWSLYDVHFWGEGARNIRWLCEMANIVPDLRKMIAMKPAGGAEPLDPHTEGTPVLPVAPALEEDRDMGGFFFQGSLRDTNGTLWRLYRDGTDLKAATTTRWLFDLVNSIPSLLKRLDNL